MKTSAPSPTPTCSPFEEPEMSLVTSTRNPADAVYRHVIPAGEPGCSKSKRGRPCACSILKAIRLSTPCFIVLTTRANVTIRSVRCAAGQCLPDDRQRAVLQPRQSAVDHRGRYLWTPRYPRRACAQESNTVRYALDKRYMHSCRDNFLCACLHDGRLHKRDIGANINFYERPGDRSRRPDL